MKPVTTVVAILLIVISIAHLLREILQANIVANGVKIPEKHIMQKGLS
jgi:hypothetical protein